MRERSEYQCISEREMGENFSAEDWERAYKTKGYSAQAAAEFYAESEQITGEEFVIVRNKATGEITHWRVEPETVFNAYKED